MAPSQFLNQCWNIVNWTLRNKPQWNLNWNSYIFIEENVFENVIWKKAAILSQPQCQTVSVWKMPSHRPVWRLFFFIKIRGQLYYIYNGNLTPAIVMGLRCMHGSFSWFFETVDTMTKINHLFILHCINQGISNHWPIIYLFSSLFRLTTKETSRLRIFGPLWGEPPVTGRWFTIPLPLCEGNPPLSGGFPSQRASNAEICVCVSWCHHMCLWLWVHWNSAYMTRHIYFIAYWICGWRK